MTLLKASIRAHLDIQAMMDDIKKFRGRPAFRGSSASRSSSVDGCFSRPEATKEPHVDPVHFETQLRSNHGSVGAVRTRSSAGSRSASQQSARESVTSSAVHPHPFRSPSQRPGIPNRSATLRRSPRPSLGPDGVVDPDVSRLLSEREVNEWAASSHDAANCDVTESAEASSVQRTNRYRYTAMTPAFVRQQQRLLGVQPLSPSGHVIAKSVNERMNDTMGQASIRTPLNGRIPPNTSHASTENGKSKRHMASRDVWLCARPDHFDGKGGLSKSSIVMVLQFLDGSALQHAPLFSRAFHDTMLRITTAAASSLMQRSSPQRPSQLPCASNADEGCGSATLEAFRYRCRLHGTLLQQVPEGYWVAIAAAPATDRDIPESTRRVGLLLLLVAAAGGDANAVELLGPELDGVVPLSTDLTWSLWREWLQRRLHSPQRHPLGGSIHQMMARQPLRDTHVEWVKRQLAVWRRDELGTGTKSWVEMCSVEDPNAAAVLRVVLTHPQLCDWDAPTMTSSSPQSPPPLEEF